MKTGHTANRYHPICWHCNILKLTQARFTYHSVTLALGLPFHATQIAATKGYRIRGTALGVPMETSPHSYPSNPHKGLPPRKAIMAVSFRMWLFAAMACSLAATLPLNVSAAPAGKKVNFASEIQPVLSVSCYQCHGPDKQAAGLRLDSRSSVIGLGRVVIPENDKESRLMHRVLGLGGKPRMPLGFAPLPEDKIGLIRAWIQEGAPWTAASATAKPKHWAYIKPVRAALPAVKEKQWVRNPIDRFVLARLEQEGLTPSPEALPEILLRRVTLDLTGLPPTIQEIDAFLADKSPEAYEKVVDRLLASPHYGERMARPWLDLARYADTNGYEKDSRRSIWPYRDWVINAFNKDMPFDEFTIEQIAGDLIPNATPEQKIATGFHRNTMYNDEGGVDREEQRWETIIDRVGTTASVWLGTTLACAQCHNHKYDPFTQKDFYSFFAFFDNVNEPELKVFSPEQEAQRKDLDPRIAAAGDLLKSITAELDKAEPQWEKDALGKPMSGPAAPPDNVRLILGTPPERRTEAQKNDLANYFHSLDPRFKDASSYLAELTKQRDSIQPATTLVMEERPTTTRLSTYLRIKGGYLSKGEQVFAGTPASLNPWPAGKPLNRLGLADWLVDENNPLTARVMTNRLWEQCFGRGIVETSEDFGTQGERPTHPALLDWLATEFMAQHWSVKSMLRLIVTSATYRESSRISPALEEKDPYNKLLARGPRFRMEGEMIRDAALAAGGELSLKIGGPSVFPYQPDGIWSLPYNDDRWQISDGEDRYRRGLYTFARRTSPYPALTTFDAPSREYCCTRRLRTNTPLQALTTLNDPAFVEAARGLAKRILNEAQSSGLRGGLTYGFRLCATRQPSIREVSRLASLYVQQLAHFRANLPAAKTMAAGSSASPGYPELAAMTVTANVLLNLDETLTKE